jgi:hypothetical protein
VGWDQTQFNHQKPAATFASSHCLRFQGQKVLVDAKESHFDAILGENLFYVSLVATGR